MRAAALLIAAALALPATAAAEAPPPGARACGGCHGGKTSAVPSLNGRPAAETAEQMRLFRAGQRPATVMDRIAKGFTDAEIDAIAAWYARQRHER